MSVYCLRQDLHDGGGKLEDLGPQKLATGYREDGAVYRFRVLIVKNGKW